MNELKKFFDNLDKLNINDDIAFFLENIIKKYFDKKYDELLQITNELIIIANMQGKNMAKAFALFEKERLNSPLTYDTYSYVAAYLKSIGLAIEDLTLNEALIILANAINLYKND